MKQFFKFVFASFVGMLLFSIITVLFGVITITGMIASSQSTKEPSENSILILDLSGQLSERAEDNIINQIQGTDKGSIGLDNILTAIKNAKENDHVKGIYIEAGAFSADSYASLQAIHNALIDFKKSKKWIIAYGDTYTQGTYYLASTANKVYLNPQGQIDWRGLASQPIYIKDLLAKFGVKMQVVKVGAYKSATEMFTGDKMSEANREQTTAYLNSIWQNITNDVSKSRNIPAGKLNQYADSMMTLAPQEDYLKTKMVDGLLYTDQVKQLIKKELGIENSEDISQVTVADLQDSNEKEGNKDNQIAI